mgnify:CR=1 FL=1
MLRFYSFIIIATLFVFAALFTSPPVSFPTDSIVNVEEGTGLYALAEKLKEDGVIRSATTFRIVATILGGERDMKAGQYQMSHPQNVFVIASRVFRGDHEIDTVKLTIPEGFTVSKISNLFDERFTLFDNERFIKLAPEGYLFPDTYFVPVSATATSTLLLFKNNFDNKIATLLGEIRDSGHTLDEVIKMASILESEVKSIEEKKIASGILWKRLSINRPLQVDSDPDTYKHIGFPPRPISNPGLESIEAAIHPTTTPYLYFLTGDDGAMHYSKTFEEHVAKKLKYIKK